MKCIQCGKEFETENKQRLYCSPKCQNKKGFDRRGLGKGVCVVCHQEFIKKINSKQEKCSDCHQKKICKGCQKEFRTRSRKAIYCSKCYYELVKKPRANEYIKIHKFGPTLCRNCGKIFIRTSGKKQCYCLECRKILKKSKKILTIPERLIEGDRKLDHRSGYVYLYVPEHPEANNRGYVYEHRVLAEQKIGRRLLINEIVHHKDEVRSNNNPDNLEVMDKFKHARLHNLGRSMYNTPVA